LLNTNLIPMTGDLMNLRTLLEETPDADLLREMINFADHRFMAKPQPVAQSGRTDRFRKPDIDSLCREGRNVIRMRLRNNFTIPGVQIIRQITTVEWSRNHWVLESMRYGIKRLTEPQASHDHGVPLAIRC